MMNLCDFYVGRAIQLDFVSGTIQERRTKENAHKTAEELKYDFFADEVTIINGTFKDLWEDRTVLFSLTHFDGKWVVDTIEVPKYD